MIAEGSNAYVCYKDGRTIKVRRSTTGGVSWAEAIIAESGGRPQYPCSLEKSGSTLHLFWVASRSNIMNLFYKKSTDDGVTWPTDETQLSSNTAPANNGGVFRFGTAIAGTMLHVVWAANEIVETYPINGNRFTWADIRYRNSNGGTSWSNTQTLTTQNLVAHRPAIAAIGSDVHVAWLDKRDATPVPPYNSRDWKIYYTRSLDGGSSWFAETRLSNTAGTQARHPQLVAPDVPTGQDPVVLIYEDGNTFDPVTQDTVFNMRIYRKRSTDRGATWSTRRRISGDVYSSHSKAAAFQANVHAVWGEDRSNGVFHSESTDGGATWTSPTTLATKGATPLDATIAVTATYAIALWGEGNTLWYRSD